MHAAAPTAAATGLFGVKFCHERAGRHALGKSVTVTAMGAGDPVLVGEMGADTDSRGLLPDVQVDEAGHFPFFVKNSGGLLEVTE
jgi:hypothetical protein